MARKPAIRKTNKRLNATDSEKAIDDFNAACAKVGLDHPAVLRSLAAAFVVHVRKYGRSVHPIEIAGPTEQA